MIFCASTLLSTKTADSRHRINLLVISTFDSAPFPQHFGVEMHGIMKNFYDL
jgi:hypothetical protein